jgi:hypothetical protein
MGYFRADEALERTHDRPQPPWNLAVQPGDRNGTLRITWNKPYGRCEGYALLAGTAPDALAGFMQLSGAGVKYCEVAVADLQPHINAEGICYLAAVTLADGETSLLSNVVALRLRQSVDLPVQNLVQPAAALQPAGSTPPPVVTEWDEIDQALRRNAATLGRHGLFIRRS